VGGFLSMLGIRVQKTSLSEKDDVIASQICRLRRLWCSSKHLYVTVPQGYLHVTCNSSMGMVWPIGCIGAIGNSRRQECRIPSKQLWLLAFSWLSQHVANKKKLFTLKNQLWLSSLQLSTKILSGRAFRPAPSPPTTAHNLLFSGGYSC